MNESNSSQHPQLWPENEIHSSSRWPGTCWHVWSHLHCSLQRQRVNRFCMILLLFAILFFYFIFLFICFLLFETKLIQNNLKHCNIIQSKTLQNNPYRLQYTTLYCSPRKGKIQHNVLAYKLVNELVGDAPEKVMHCVTGLTVRTPAAWWLER